MKVIQTETNVGDDRMLHVRLPADVPTGRVEVLVVVQGADRRSDPARRRAAAKAGTGALRHLDLSIDEFLAERRADDVRRDRALGL
jgi:hypothetical protein